MLLDGLTRMARAVPLQTGYRVADLASEIHRLASRPRREAVESNLRSLGVTEPPVAARHVYRHFGRTLFEFLRGPYVPELPTRFEGWDHLEAARARGRGALVVTPHTGNWTHAAAATARRGVPVAAVAGIQLSRSWTTTLRARQQRDGLRILPPGVASWREIPRILASNHVVALLVDGDLFRGALACDTRYGTVRFPTGPAKLAIRTGAPILPGWVLRDADGGVCVGFGPEIPVDVSDPDVVAHVTRAMLRVVLGKVGEHPDQWLLFRRFFDAGATIFPPASVSSPRATRASTGPAAWEGTP